MDAVEFNLHDSLEESVKTFAFRASEKGIELLCEMGPGVPALVLADPARLRQVITNLLGNALKFTENGEVSLRVLKEDAPGDGCGLHFTVSDTGIGIPLEKQELIFQAFSQADTSTARKYGGTGLGLTICSRLVRMMGGRIWVCSEAGKGSSFHFTVTVQSLSPASLDTLPATGPLAGVAILVVDHSAAHRRILAGILSSWGMKVSEASEAAEALDVLARDQNPGSRFKVVLADDPIPGTDGFAFARQVTAACRPAPAITLMLSPGERRDPARCRLQGVANCVTKPLRRADLRAALLQALGSGSDPALAAGSALDGLNLAQPPNRRLRILLAEDNPVNQQVARKFMERRGHSVTVAGNGREAIDLAAQQTFDLVLMDVQMPEMDGFEATRAIRAFHSEKHLPIVAMTAHAMRGDREKCLGAGMDDYIAKPLAVSSLSQALDKWLR